MAKCQKNNKVGGLFVIPFKLLILKTVSPLDPHLLTARRNPGSGHGLSTDCAQPLHEPKQT